MSPQDPGKSPKQIRAIMISTENIKLKGWVQAPTTNSCRRHKSPQMWCLVWALDLAEPKLWNSLLLFRHRKIMSSNRCSKPKISSYHGPFVICNPRFVFSLYRKSWSQWFWKNLPSTETCVILDCSFLFLPPQNQHLSSSKSCQLYKIIPHYFAIALVHTIIISHLDYCNSLLPHPCFSPVVLQCLLISAATDMLINKKPGRSSSSEEWLLCHSGWKAQTLFWFTDTPWCGPC